jgi:hypothetical protein
MFPSHDRGRADEDGLVDDFILGMIDSTKELGSPFISESIWTAGLADIFVRGGLTREGRRLWNPQDAAGTKIYNSLGHLVETQAPLNWKQLTRLGLSMKPVVGIDGKFDERGSTYDLGNELLGIAGLRRVTIDPEESFNYKITEYKKGIRDSRNLFTSATLKGGEITPEQIVDAYVNANRALYGVNRNMYLDMEAAKVLGMSDDSLAQDMTGRGERRAFGFINQGRFRPLSISRDVIGLFQKNAEKLGTSNPYEQAAGVIGRIREVLSETPLDGDLFPNITNPFSVSIMDDAVAQANQLINNNPANAAMAAAPTAGFIGQGNVNIDAVTGLTREQDLIYNNPIDRAIARKQNKQKTVIT